VYFHGKLDFNPVKGGAKRGHWTPEADLPGPG